MNPNRPLKPLIFEILLALAIGPQHGYAIAKELETRPGAPKILPANLYRTLHDLAAKGWIEECEPPADGPQVDARRRYFQITDAGREVARHEAERLERMVQEARDRRILTTAPGT